MLHVQVSADGKPLVISVAQSSGFPRLDKAAESAVKGWRFVPARRGDEALASWVDIPIQFSLKQ